MKYRDMEARCMLPAAASGLLFFLLAASGACLYHSDDVCSPGEVKDPATDACVCGPNTVPVKRPVTVLFPKPTDQALVSMCAPCGEHSRAQGGACVCDEGYVSGPSGCVRGDLGNLGAACASDDDCAGGPNPHCQRGTGAGPDYCTTTGCASNADCNGAADYACATGASPTFCRRAPLDQGKACTMQGLDPSCGAEAPICGLGQCFAIGCASDGDCSPSRRCCDLSAFQPGVHACLAACP